MLIDALTKHTDDKIALQEGERYLTYGALPAAIAEKKQALKHVTLLAIVLDNGIDWILWDLAAWEADIPCLPIPPFFTEAQIQHALHMAGASHIITPAGLKETGMTPSTDLPRGTQKITFTSGTTATPKGVCLPKSAMAETAYHLCDLLGRDFVGTHACILPLAVLLENVAGVYTGLMAGCTLKITKLEEFGADYCHLHALLSEMGATSVILVPEILRILMAQIMTQGPLDTLKFIAVGGSKIDASLIQQARAMGLPVYEGYGLSEACSVIALNMPEQDRIGTVGKILPHIQITIDHDEVILKSSGFLGYIGTENTGTFATGDIGHLDDDGFLSITGRKKNVLITAYGRNISPEWPESLLLSTPAIAQAVVYGDRQAALSALIVPTSADASIAEAVAHVNQSLPPYAQIKDFKIVPPFTLQGQTLTGTGRPRRTEILAQYAKKGA